MSEWGKGYEAGQVGLDKAVVTAKLSGALAERNRIIRMLEDQVADDENNYVMLGIIRLIRGDLDE